MLILTFYHLPLPHSGDLHFHVPNYYLYAIPTAVIIGLIFLTYFGARFGIESRKRTEALNKLELILAKEHELESIGVQAAAAAHSLGTPLSTITVVAKELEKEIGNNTKYSKDIDGIIYTSVQSEGSPVVALKTTSVDRAITHLKTKSYHILSNLGYGQFRANHTHSGIVNGDKIKWE